MLQTITLDGFRCFDRPTAVEFGSLTVLAGANNVGKSSVVHALMALMQSAQQQSGNLLRLSGEWVNLGTFRQTVNYARSGDQRRFSIGLTGSSLGRLSDVLWTFAENDDLMSDSARIERIEALDGDKQFCLESDGEGYRRILEDQSPHDKLSATLFHPSRFEVLFPDGRSASEDLFDPCSPDSVLYIGAYRDPPKALYQARRSLLGPVLGSMGEYTAEVLLRRERTIVDVLPANDSTPVALPTALNRWWSHIFDRPYMLRAQMAQGLGFTLTLDTPSAENLGLGQVGLGLSQALPVVALSLCSKPGDIVIIESPEIHLHPAAQHRLSDLFVGLARAGRQVVLETHSDHMVNAIRLAVKRGDNGGGLASERVAVHFFTQEAGIATVERVPIDENGRLERWPQGFFDQASQTLLEIIR